MVDEVAETYELIASLDAEETPLSKLIKMCDTMSVKKNEMDEALDNEDSKNALAKLLETAATKYKTKEDALKAEIENVKQKIQQECDGKGMAWLQKRASAEGFDVIEIEKALDGDNGKSDLLKLILNPKVLKAKVLQQQKEKRAEEEEMSQFASMKLSALKRKATELGVGDNEIDDALDSEDGFSTLCRLIVSKSKRLKSNSNDALLNSDDPQAATVIPQAVVTAVPPSTNAVSTVSPMVAYTNCRSDNVLEVMYIKAGQTTIHGTSKGVGVFAAQGMTIYLTPAWGTPSESFVAICQQFTFKQPVRIKNVAGASNGREWTLCKDLRNAHFRPLNNCTIEKLDDDTVGDFGLGFTPYGILHKFKDWEVISVKGFVYETNANTNYMSLLENETVVQVRFNANITMPSERDEVELIGASWSTKFNQLTIEDYTHMSVKKAARTTAWPIKLKRIGQ